MLCKSGADACRVGAVGDATAGGDKELTDERADERQPTMLVAFRTSYGLFIATAHSAKPDFCAAAKLKLEPDGMPAFLE